MDVRGLYCHKAAARHNTPSGQLLVRYAFEKKKLKKISVTSAASLSGAFALAIWDKSGFLMPCMRLM